MNKEKRSMESLQRLDAHSFKAAQKAPVYVVLDNVRSALNTGSIFRSADAFRCEGMILCGITAKPPHREINKTALGATETVAWQYIEKVEDAIGLLKGKGYRIAAVEQAQGSIDIGNIELQNGVKWAFIFGNEVEGVSQHAIELADAVVEISQFGSKHSLNVAVCAGIVLWHTAGRVLQRDVH